MVKRNSRGEGEHCLGRGLTDVLEDASILKVMQMSPSH